MSAPDRDQVATTDSTTPETLGSKAARVIEDPFGSIWVGLVGTATAVGAVASGILGLSVIY